MQLEIRAAFAILAAMLALPAAASPWKEFRDFHAWCSNGMTCSAEVYAEGASVNGFGLSRKAGRDQPVELYFNANAPFAEGSDVYPTVDGKALEKIPASAFVRNEDHYRNVIGDQAVVFRLIEALRNGNRLDLNYSDAEGKKTARIPLSGLAASLTWLDDVQGRVGARDAIVAKGDKESPEFTVRDINSVDQLPEDLKADFTGDGECAFYEPRRFDLAGGFEDRFGPNDALLVVPCAEGGAYNQPFSLYWVTDSGSRALALPAMGELGPVVIEEAWNVDWDARERVLEAFFKGRGIGDCGLYDKWKLIGAPDMPQFTLIESRRKDECDGEGGPDTFPYQWPPGKR